MADFLLNGRVNTGQITSDIVNAVTAASASLKSRQLQLSVGKVKVSPSALSDVKKMLSSTIEITGAKIIGQASGVTKSLTNTISKDAAAQKESVGAFKGVTGALKSLTNKLSSVLGGISSSKKFATGGVVPGTGNSDTVPAMLTPGEFVINKKAASVIGSASLHRMNRSGFSRGGKVKGGVQYFAGGGVVVGDVNTSGRVGVLAQKGSPGQFSGTGGLLSDINVSASLMKSLGKIGNSKIPGSKNYLKNALIRGNFPVFNLPVKAGQTEVSGVIDKIQSDVVKNIITSTGNIKKLLPKAAASSFSTKLSPSEIKKTLSFNQVSGRIFEAFTRSLIGSFEKNSGTRIDFKNQDIGKLKKIIPSLNGNNKVDNLDAKLNFPTTKPTFGSADNNVISMINKTLSVDGKRGSKLFPSGKNSSTLIKELKIFGEATKTNADNAEITAGVTARTVFNLLRGGEQKLSVLDGLRKRVLAKMASRGFLDASGEGGFTTNDLAMELRKSSVKKLLDTPKGAKTLVSMPSDKIEFFKGVPIPIGKATGGSIPGSGNTDTVPAMLTPGEFVINKKAASVIGESRLQQLNNAHISGTPNFIAKHIGGSVDVQKFAHGGVVRPQRLAFGGGVLKLNHGGGSGIGGDNPLIKIGAGAKNLNQDLTGINRLFGLMGDSIAKATLRMAAFNAASRLIFTIQDAFSQAVRSVIDLDQAITNVNKIFNLGASDLSNFKSGLIDLAKESGQSISDVVSATQIFVQQGLSQQDVLLATKAALLGVNAANLTLTQSTELLTVAVNAFGGSYSESVDIIDSVSGVADASAATVQDLTVILQKSGATAHEFGVSLNELVGIGATVRESTRLMASTVGSSLKSIFVGLQKNEGLLNKNKIATRNNNLEMLSSAQILKNMSVAFRTMGDVQKKNLLISIAGKRRINELSAIVENFSKVQNLTAVSLNSAGVAAAKQAKQMETLKAKIAQISAGLVELVDVVGKTGISQFFSLLLSAIKPVVGAITAVIGVLGSVPGALPIALIAAFGKTIKNSLISLKDGISGTINSILGIKDAAASVAASVQGNFKSNEASVRSFSSSVSQAIQLQEKLRSKIARSEINNSISTSDINNRTGLIGSFSQLTSKDLRGKFQKKAFLQRSVNFSKSLLRLEEQINKEIEQGVVSIQKQIDLNAQLETIEQNKENLLQQQLTTIEEINILEGKAGKNALKLSDAQRATLKAQQKQRAAAEKTNFSFKKMKKSLFENKAMLISMAGVLLSSLQPAVKSITLSMSGFGKKTKEGANLTDNISEGFKSVQLGIGAAVTAAVIFTAVTGGIALAIGAVVAAAAGLVAFFTRGSREAKRLAEETKKIGDVLRSNADSEKKLRDEINNSGGTASLSATKQLDLAERIAKLRVDQSVKGNGFFPDTIQIKNINEETAKALKEVQKGFDGEIFDVSINVKLNVKKGNDQLRAAVQKGLKLSQKNTDAVGGAALELAKALNAKFREDIRGAFADPIQTFAKIVVDARSSGKFEKTDIDRFIKGFKTVLKRNIESSHVGESVNVIFDALVGDFNKAIKNLNAQQTTGFLAFGTLQNEAASLNKVLDTLGKSSSIRKINEAFVKLSSSSVAGNISNDAQKFRDLEISISGAATELKRLNKIKTDAGAQLGAIKSLDPETVKALPKQVKALDKAASAAKNAGLVLLNATGDKVKPAQLALDEKINELKSLINKNKGNKDSLVKQEVATSRVLLKVLKSIAKVSLDEVGAQTGENLDKAASTALALRDDIALIKFSQDLQVNLAKIEARFTKMSNIAKNAKLEFKVNSTPVDAVTLKIQKLQQKISEIKKNNIASDLIIPPPSVSNNDLKDIEDSLLAFDVNASSATKSIEDLNIAMAKINPNTLSSNDLAIFNSIKEQLGKAEKFLAAKQLLIALGFKLDKLTFDKDLAVLKQEISKQKLFFDVKVKLANQKLSFKKMADDVGLLNKKIAAVGTGKTFTLDELSLSLDDAKRKAASLGDEIKALPANIDKVIGAGIGVENGLKKVADGLANNIRGGNIKKAVADANTALSKLGNVEGADNQAFQKQIIDFINKIKQLPDAEKVVLQAQLALKKGTFAENISKIQEDVNTENARIELQVNLSVKKEGFKNLLDEISILRKKQVNLNKDFTLDKLGSQLKNAKESLGGLSKATKDSAENLSDFAKKSSDLGDNFTGAAKDAASLLDAINNNDLKLAKEKYDKLSSAMKKLPTKNLTEEQRALQIRIQKFLETLSAQIAKLKNIEDLKLQIKTETNKPKKKIDELLNFINSSEAHIRLSVDAANVRITIGKLLSDIAANKVSLSVAGTNKAPSSDTKSLNEQKRKLSQIFEEEKKINGEIELRIKALSKINSKISAKKPTKEFKLLSTAVKRLTLDIKGAKNNAGLLGDAASRFKDSLTGIDTTKLSEVEKKFLASAQALAKLPVEKLKKDLALIVLRIKIKNDEAKQKIQEIADRINDIRSKSAFSINIKSNSLDLSSQLSQLSRLKSQFSNISAGTFDKNNFALDSAIGKLGEAESRLSLSNDALSKSGVTITSVFGQLDTSNLSPNMAQVAESAKQFAAAIATGDVSKIRDQFIQTKAIIDSLDLSKLNESEKAALDTLTAGFANVKTQLESEKIVLQLKLKLQAEALNLVVNEVRAAFSKADFAIKVRAQIDNIKINQKKISEKISTSLKKQAITARFKAIIEPSLKGGAIEKVLEAQRKFIQQVAKLDAESAINRASAETDAIKTRLKNTIAAIQTAASQRVAVAKLSGASDSQIKQILNDAARKIHLASVGAAAKAASITVEAASKAASIQLSAASAFASKAQSSFDSAQSEVDSAKKALADEKKRVAEAKKNGGTKIQGEEKLKSANEAIQQATKGVADAQIALRDAILEYKAGIFDAAISVGKAAIDIQNFIGTLSIKEKLLSLQTLLNDNLATLIGNEKKIFEARKQFADEAVSLIETEIQRLRDLGESQFTASRSDIRKQNIARSQIDQVKSGQVDVSRFNAQNQSQDRANEFLKQLKIQVASGDQKAEDILKQIQQQGLAQQGLDPNSIENLVSELRTQQQISAQSSARLAVSSNQSVVAAQQSLDVARDKLAEARAARTELRLQTAEQKNTTNKIADLTKKLNKAKEKRDKAKGILQKADDAVAKFIEAASKQAENASKSLEDITGKNIEENGKLVESMVRGLSDNVLTPLSGVIPGLSDVLSQMPKVMQNTNDAAVKAAAAATSMDAAGIQLETSATDISSAMTEAKTAFNEARTAAQAAATAALAAEGAANAALGLARSSSGSSGGTTNGTSSNYLGANVPNFAKGSLTSQEKAGLLAAAIREKQHKPAGSKLVVANSSETILTKKQSGRAFGKSSSIKNMASGNPNLSLAPTTTFEKQLALQIKQLKVADKNLEIQRKMANQISRDAKIQKDRGFFGSIFKGISNFFGETAKLSGKVADASLKQSDIIRKHFNITRKDTVTAGATDLALSAAGPALENLARGAAAGAKATGLLTRTAAKGIVASKRVAKSVLSASEKIASASSLSNGVNGFASTGAPIASGLTDANAAVPLVGQVVSQAISDAFKSAPAVVNNTPTSANPKIAETQKLLNKTINRRVTAEKENIKSLAEQDRIRKTIARLRADHLQFLKDQDSKNKVSEADAEQAHKAKMAAAKANIDALDKTNKQLNDERLAKNAAFNKAHPNIVTGLDVPKQSGGGQVNASSTSVGGNIASDVISKATEVASTTKEAAVALSAKNLTVTSNVESVSTNANSIAEAALGISGDISTLSQNPFFSAAGQAAAAAAPSSTFSTTPTFASGDTLPNTGQGFVSPNQLSQVQQQNQSTDFIQIQNAKGEVIKTIVDFSDSVGKAKKTVDEFVKVGDKKTTTKDNSVLVGPNQSTATRSQSVSPDAKNTSSADFEKIKTSITDLSIQIDDTKTKFSELAPVLSDEKSEIGNIVACLKGFCPEIDAIITCLGALKTALGAIVPIANSVGTSLGGLVTSIESAGSAIASAAASAASSISAAAASAASAASDVITQSPNAFSGLNVSNFAGGSLTPQEKAGLIISAIKEKNNKPSGSNLVIANSSETILTKRQAEQLFGNISRGNSSITNAASGSFSITRRGNGNLKGGAFENAIQELTKNVKGLDVSVKTSIASTENLSAEIKNNSSSISKFSNSSTGAQRRSQPAIDSEVSIKLSVDSNRTINLSGVSSVASGITDSIKEKLGGVATKDEVSAISNVVNNVILEQLQRRGIVKTKDRFNF